MEWLFGLLVIVTFTFGPIVLSIIALIRASRSTSEVRELRRLVQAMSQGEAASKGKPAPAEPVRVSPPAVPAPAPSPAPVARPPVLPVPGRSLEVQLGGKVASFIGIAALVLGVVFFVGYAIQHDWIGPGTRIVLGLMSGGVLAGLGHLAETRGKNLHILARALTGGGAALFYFCVFAAYGIYQLVGAWTAVGGLVLSAAAVLALAVVYDSEAVAVLGVLGAFVAPQVVGGGLDHGVFPLAFIAVVNVPVLLLGLKRRWQVLYNLAFILTVGIAAAWLDRELPGLESGAWATGLCFVLVFFAEFVALGLVKLTGERAVTGRRVDIIRLALCSLALLGALYWILSDAKLDGWMGGAFLAVALAHIGLTRMAWTWRPKFTDETLTLLIGGLTFASLALPAQLDGAWVSLGWAIEGVILAWFGLRVGSTLLQSLAMGLGLFGLVKSVVYDNSLYSVPPRLFLNGRFVVGILSAAGLGVQGWFHGRAKIAGPKPSSSAWNDALTACAVLGLVAVATADAFFALPFGDPWPWLLSTLFLLAAGAATTLAARPVRSPVLWALGVVLMLAVPVKLALFDLGTCRLDYVSNYPVFMNGVFAAQLVVLVVAMYWSGRLTASSVRKMPPGVILNILSVLAGVFLVTMEIARSRSPWSGSFITLWWAVCALALALTGLVRRRAYLRYLALFVFGATGIKVFFVDLADLGGLQRVAAFMGVGLLLLLLSFAYQRVAPVLLGKNGKKSADEVK